MTKTQIVLLILLGLILVMPLKIYVGLELSDFKIYRYFKGGNWYYVSYTDLESSTISGLFPKKWVQSDKAIGIDFEIIKTEKYDSNKKRR
jgi:hypothetical protein